MFSYKISCDFRYSSNSAASAVVRGNTLEDYDLSPLKNLWDFGVVCLNLPYIHESLMLMRVTEHYYQFTHESLPTAV